MSVGSRHVAVVGLAMILLLAGMFVPSRGLALACGGAALVCMLLAVFIVQFGSSKPLNSLEAWLKKTSSAEKFSPVPEYLGHDFAPLAALMEDALKECKTLREECGQERERAEKAEQELARTKTSLTAIQDQARQDE